MRGGHKSGGQEQGFDTRADRPIVEPLQQQKQLKDKDGAQNQQLVALEASGRRLRDAVKDLLELGVDRFNRL